MIGLPRSARLATWGSSWLSGGIDLSDVVNRVRESDEPHDVRTPSGTSVPLADALYALRTAGARGLAVALPRPGDPVGLAGPRELTEAAVDAGEAVVAVGAPAALVPDITPFGPPGDQGHFVTWTWHNADPPPHADPATVEQQLDHALLAAGATLASLDVAAWRPEVAQLLDDVRAGREAAPLPHDAPVSAQRLAARSMRLWAIAEFALGDDGAAVTATAADARRRALLDLERAARHGVVAACNQSYAG